MSTVLDRPLKRTPGFGCRACGDADTRVVDSRPVMVGQLPSIRRRRRCLKCDERFSTFELEIEEIERRPEITGQVDEALGAVERALRRLSDLINGRNS